MSLNTVLRNSLIELTERPEYFVPRLISTSISTAWLIYIASSLNITFYIATAPLIAFIGIFVLVMVAYMVDNDADLESSFLETLHKSKKLVAATLLFFLAGAIASVPTVAGIIIYSLNKSIAAVAVGGIASLLIILGIGLFTYFLPITLNRENLLDSFRRSASFSNSRRKEVLILILFSFSLLALSFASSGLLQALGLIGFIVGRLISAVVSTYLIIVSPKYYIENE